MKDFTKIPDENAIKEAADLEIFDVKGERIKFGSLFEEQKTIVVFIRHFFCGICQSYVERLAEVPTEALDAAETRIVIIGCGEYTPIEAYKETTKFSGSLYADPTRKLYRALGMDVETLKGTPAGETKKSYVPLSVIGNVFTSLWRGPFKHPLQIGKQGNFSQLGGDFIFGPGNVCTFASRMRNTQDHVEIADLMKGAGVVYP